MWCWHLLAHFWVAVKGRWKRNLLPSGANQHLSPVAEMAGGCSQWFLRREEKEVTVWQTWWFTGLGKWCLWEWGRSARWCFLQEEARLALLLLSAGVVCCSFLQKILGKWPKEPWDSWVRISEYLGRWRTEGNHNRCSHVVRRERIGERCRETVGENWVLERETSVRLSLGFRVLSVRLSLWGVLLIQGGEQKIQAVGSGFDGNYRGKAEERLH